jgi:acetylornithine deacetylase/succinyl-diaminopimelate desuccinylase-like protein
MRAAFPDAVACGFCPFIVEDGGTVRRRLHGVDERITVADLVLQARFCERLATALLA